MGPVGTKGETEKHFCIPPKKCLNVPCKWQRQATTTPNFASKCTDTIFLNFALHDDNYYCHREFPKFESSQQRPHSGIFGQAKPKTTLCKQQHHHTTTSGTGRRCIGTPAICCTNTPTLATPLIHCRFVGLCFILFLQTIYNT